MSTRIGVRNQASMAAAIAMALSMGAAPPAHTVEGGVGRPITGQQITPFAGIIPPESGFIWQLGYITYEGDIGAARQIPNIVGQRLEGPFESSSRQIERE